MSVDALMQRMRTLSQKQSECSETELNDRFKTVEMQAHELPDTIKVPIIEIPENINHFIEDPLFTYQDFSRRGAENVPSTFRVQGNIHFLVLVAIPIKFRKIYHKYLIHRLFVGWSRFFVGQSFVQWCWRFAWC